MRRRLHFFCRLGQTIVHPYYIRYTYYTTHTQRPPLTLGVLGHIGANLYSRASGNSGKGPLLTLHELGRPSPFYTRAPAAWAVERVSGESAEGCKATVLRPGTLPGVKRDSC